MSVGSYDPGGRGVALNEVVLGELLAAAGRLEEPMFGLDRLTVARLAPLAKLGGADWAAAAAELPAEQLEALIRFFTLAEALPGWESGAKSPVIALAAELKRRDAYPRSLTRWIRAHSQNRFLPHGSLMDRL